jgi:hypothetical protein
MFPVNLAIQNSGKEMFMPPKKKTEAEPSDETDVQAAIDSETQDGKGSEPVPPSDFESFATAGVHAEDKAIEELASEVLRGHWGDYSVSRSRLNDAGHDSSVVLAAVNRRMAGGAPAAYRPTSIELLNQVRMGEWGTDRGLRERLNGAGFSAAVVEDVLRTLARD